MTRKVGLYLRISKDVKGEAAGVDRQRVDGERVIAQRGWELYRMYVDNDITARGTKRRPEYEQMLRDLDAGLITAVVARSMERVFKTRREQLTFMELGQEKRILVAFSHAPDIDFQTAVGRGVADMQAAWARIEMEQKSERQRDQAAQVAGWGLPHAGGRRAFGYTSGGLHLEPGEASAVRQMYDQWLTGMSMSSIAHWLNEAGWVTPQGNRFTKQTVREILANPRNGGLRGVRDVVNQKTGTRAQWHRIIGPAKWPGVVSEATWRAAMDKIRDTSRPGWHEGRNGQRYLLSGIAGCGVCGQRLITGGRRSERVLRCPSRAHISRRADYIEAFVEEAVLEWFRRPDTTPLTVTPSDGPDVGELRRESIELRARLDGLARDYADGVLDRAGVKTAGDRLRARLSEIDAEVAAAGQVDVTAPLRAAEDPGPVWERMPLATRREILRRVVTVTVLSGSPGRPGGVRFDPASVQIVFAT